MAILLGGFVIDFALSLIWTSTPSGLHVKEADNEPYTGTYDTLYLYLGQPR